MPVFDFAGPDGKTHSIEGPDGSTPEQALQMLQQQLAPPKAPQGFVANAVDVAKTIPGALLSGLTSLPNSNPALSPEEQQAETASRAQANQSLQQQGITHAPEGMPARFAQSAGEMVGNPMSYIGPGSLPLKIGGAIMSGLGGQAGEEVGGTPGRIAGSVLGGVAAAKTLGAKPAEAEIPKRPELLASAETGYDAARGQKLDLNPAGPAAWANNVEQNLTNGPKYAFTGGANGTAPKTLGTLAEIQSPPPDGIVTGANLDTLRIRLGNIAGETSEGKPTPDAKAATVALRDLAKYRENIPQSHVLAGDPVAYSDAVRQANGDYAAAQRMGTVQQKVDNAVTNYEGGIATPLAGQIKSQIRPILKNPKQQRGFTADEVSGLNDVNKGTFTSNLLSQLGRGGAGVIPMIAQASTAIATGGATVPAQLGLMALLYGARKGGEQMTLAQVNKVIENLGKRSPLYQKRIAQLPQVDTTGNSAQMLRSLLGGIR